MTEITPLLQSCHPGAQDHGDQGVSFGLYAPGKRCVSLIGSFNDWDGSREPMADRGDGFWVAHQSLPRGKHEYQFLIDNELVVCDPYATEVRWPDDPEQPAWAVIDAGRPIYQWRHEDWQRPNFEDLIVYELHVGDFSPSGSLRGVIDQLDYLSDLGVNAIEFMPLYETRPGDYWGYEPMYYLAVRSRFGSFEDMLELVDSAHARGIAVIADLVLAHTAHAHPFNQMYPYDASPWYGQGMGEPNQFGLPTLDYSKPPTNDFVRDVQNYWLRVFHIDGFRYDYLVGIGSDDKGRGLPMLMNVARTIRPRAYLIGEAIPEAPDMVNDSALCGVWHTRCRIALQVLLSQRDVVPYTWENFGEAVAAFDPSTQDYNKPSLMVNYFECHDDARIVRAVVEAGFDEETAARKSALGASVLMTLPGEVMLYHGQEWGEASEKSQQANKIHWERLGEQRGRGLHNHYRRLCRLRRGRASLRSDNFKFLRVEADSRCIVYYRWLGEADQVVVAANFSDQPRTLSVDLPVGGPWREFFADRLLQVDGTLSWTLEPQSAAIFTQGVS